MWRAIRSANSSWKRARRIGMVLPLTGIRSRQSRTISIYTGSMISPVFRRFKAAQSAIFPMNSGDCWSGCRSRKRRRKGRCRMPPGISTMWCWRSIIRPKKSGFCHLDYRKRTRLPGEGNVSSVPNCFCGFYERNQNRKLRKSSSRGLRVRPGNRISSVTRICSPLPEWWNISSMAISSRPTSRSALSPICRTALHNGSSTKHCAGVMPRLLPPTWITTIS